MDKDKVAKVIHYYDKIGVVIVKLQKVLKVGDKIKFMKGENTFEETIESMQVEHKAISEAKKGQEIGIKVNQPTKEGTLVYKA